MPLTNRYRLFRRSNGIYFIEDRESRKQESLKTRQKVEAERLFNARNESHLQPALNLHIARAYLMGADANVNLRTWQHVMEEIVKTKAKGPTRERWEMAIKDEALDAIRVVTLLGTKAEQLLLVTQGIYCLGLRDSASLGMLSK